MIVHPTSDAIAKVLKYASHRHPLHVTFCFQVTMTKSWLPLESNPDVMNEYVAKMGLDITKVQFHGRRIFSNVIDHINAS